MEENTKQAIENEISEAAIQTAEAETSLGAAETVEETTDTAAEPDGKRRNKVFTIPNVLTMIRIALIPVFVVLYLKGNYAWSLVVIGLSALTDILDGFIARRFHMVSDFGKALDPIADKLSQMALMFCLCFRYPYILIPLGLIIVKELVSGILVLVTIHKTGVVKGADWHGKVSTVCLYSMMMLHVLWFSIPPLVSYISVAVCVTMMLVSFTLYMIRFIRDLKTNSKSESAEEVQEAGKEQK